MISLGDMRPARRRSAGTQQRRLPVWHKRLAEIIDLTKNLDDPIQHHRLRHSAIAAYLKKPFCHNLLIARKPLIRVKYDSYVRTLMVYVLPLLSPHPPANATKPVIDGDDGTAGSQLP